MKEIAFEENKKIQLQILCEVAQFCDSHHLVYFLTYGTLIGAVRHKGFIPWDDDIDIQMPRQDYNSLIQTFNSRVENKNLLLVEPGTSLSKHSIVKIIDTRTVKIEPGIDYKDGYLGVDIDVFPIDGMPEDDKEYELWRKKLLSIYRKAYAANSAKKGAFKHRIHLWMINPFNKPAKYWLEKASQLHSRYPYESSKFVGSMEHLWNGAENRVSKECFSEAIEAEFEGYIFKIPKGYDELLNSLYGNYMQLPPKEQQITHHSNRVYWKD